MHRKSVSGSVSLRAVLLMRASYQSLQSRACQASIKLWYRPQAPSLACQKIRGHFIQVAAYRVRGPGRQVVLNGIPGVFIPRRCTRVSRPQPAFSEETFKSQTAVIEEQEEIPTTPTPRDPRLLEQISLLQIDLKEEAESLSYHRRDDRLVRQCLTTRLGMIGQVVRICFNSHLRQLRSFPFGYFRHAIHQIRCRLN